MYQQRAFQLCVRSFPKGSRLATHSSSTASSVEQADEEIKHNSNLDIKPSKTFINRNPRNLERLALSHKDRGWGKRLFVQIPSANFPTRDYYHRICLERTWQHTYAWLEHYYGDKVIEVSTKDWEIRKHLYKSTDVTASGVVGSVLVELCIRAGISCAAWRPASETDSQAVKAFCDAFTKTGFSLEEPDQIQFKRRLPHFTPLGPKPPKIV